LGTLRDDKREVGPWEEPQVLPTKRSEAERKTAAEPSTTAIRVQRLAVIVADDFTMPDELDLVDWRRRVGDLYRLPSHMEWRAARDVLFREHPQSPIPVSERASFSGLVWFPYDAAYRVDALWTAGDGSRMEIDTGGEDGVVLYRRAGVLRFSLGGAALQLTAFRQQGYGGGLFIPFADATSRHETYGAGRYLADTVKNTDGHCLVMTPGSDRVVLDLNFAYNPSCVYDERWACPLAPPENRLPVAIRAGEQVWKPHTPAS